MDIHIFWEGPYSLEGLSQLNDESQDYGIYQIYGHHLLYGSSVLLYIGQANDQTFKKRIKQGHWEYYEPDLENKQIYVGRLAGHKFVTQDEWAEKIDQAEKLLIYAHAPAYNTSNTCNIPEPYVLNNHIFNWGKYRSLLPEVSGKRYTSRYEHITEEKIYSLERSKE